jgi:phosphate transport system substrate-binding protein
MRQIVNTVIFVVLLLSLNSCKKEKGDGWEDTLTSGFIRIACDESFKSLMDMEIDAFEARNPNALIVPIYTNETGAIRLLIADSVRFALTTRDLRSKEKAEIKSKQMKVRKYLIAFDGIALITNKQNQDSIIDFSTFKKIIQGEITEWTQINPDSHFGAIRVIFDSKESGVLRYVVDSISAGGVLSPNLYALNSNTEVLKKVEELPNALGLISINALNNVDQKNIRMMRIDGYLPYAGDIRQEDYPLWRPVYVLLSDPRTGLSTGLSVFISLEIGQRIVFKSGLLPITDSYILDTNFKDEYPK